MTRDTLLLVLRHLPRAAMPFCRAVCRRWRDTIDGCEALHDPRTKSWMYAMDVNAYADNVLRAQLDGTGGPYSNMSLHAYQLCTLEMVAERLYGVVCDADACARLSDGYTEPLRVYTEVLRLCARRLGRTSGTCVADVMFELCSTSNTYALKELVAHGNGTLTQKMMRAATHSDRAETVAWMLDSGVPIPGDLLMIAASCSAADPSSTFKMLLNRDAVCSSGSGVVRRACLYAKPNTLRLLREHRSCYFQYLHSDLLECAVRGDGSDVAVRDCVRIMLSCGIKATDNHIKIAAACQGDIALIRILVAAGAVVDTDACLDVACDPYLRRWLQNYHGAPHVV